MQATQAHILVVDDDELTRNVLCQMLTAIGYVTTVAGNGVEALRNLESNDTVNFVLTDINMPQMDGWELAVHVKALNPCIPVVAVTGENAESMRERVANSAICHALFKPFKLHQLKEMIPYIMESETARCFLGKTGGSA